MRKLFITGLIAGAIFSSCKRECFDEPGTAPVKNTISSGTITLDGTIDNPKKLKGRVKSAAFVDIENATVGLYDATGSTLLKSTFSNDTGGLVIDSINPGDYDLKITAPGYLQKVLEITVLSTVPEYDAGIIYMQQ